MPPRVNPILLLGLVIVLVLSLGIMASAQLAGDPTIPVDPTLAPVDPALAPVDPTLAPVDPAIGTGQAVDPVLGGTGLVGAAPAQDPAAPAPTVAPVGGGTAGDALGVGEAQVGKPHVEGADGPDAFSCVGLMRYILRNIGVDANAPWSPEAYLGTYTPVDPANLQPGDIVIYPGWATMYAGNGMLLNSNAVDGVVTNTPMDTAGTPSGIVRPPYS